MESRNPTIVRILEEKGDVIENRHSGIPTMKREMKNYHLPEPEFYEERDSFKVVFRNGGQQNVQVDNKMSKKDLSGQQNNNKNLNLTTNDYQNMILEFCKEPKTAVEIKKYLKIKSRQYVSAKIIKPLINAGSLEYTNKLNINARNQKYKTKIFKY